MAERVDSSTPQWTETARRERPPRAFGPGGLHAAVDMVEANGGRPSRSARREPTVEEPAETSVQVSVKGVGMGLLVMGAVLAATGIGVMSGKTWARVLAIAPAALSLLANIAFFSAYPLWSAIVIVLGAVVIYALVAHGREISRSSNRPDPAGAPTALGTPRVPTRSPGVCAPHPPGSSAGSTPRPETAPRAWGLVLAGKLPSRSRRA